MGVSPWEMDVSLRNEPIRSLSSHDEVQTFYVVNPASNATLRSPLEVMLLVLPCW